MKARGARRDRLALTVDANGDAWLGEHALFSGTQGDLLALLDSLVARDRVAFVATPNVDHVIELEENDLFARAYRQADVRPVDGAPVVGLARLLGARRVERLTGADLLFAVCAQAARSGRRVVISGGADSALEAAVTALRNRHSGLQIEGVRFPVMAMVGDPRSLDVVRAIADESPDFVFLCLGTPKQETWFATWSASLPPAVYIGAGAAVDFAAGTSRRAPRWMQRAGAEWLWRLAREPRRLAHRYLVRGPRFVSVVVRSLVLSRRAR